MLPDLPFTKEELKERLPLQYACSRLGIRLDRAGRAKCPLHSPDDQPSFYLYDHPADGAVLWHCQPCGKGGDVLQLLVEVEGLTFPEALNRASELLRELPGDYTPEFTLAPAFTDEGPHTWGLELADDAARAAAHPGALAERTRMFDRASPQAAAFDAYARTQWAWGISDDGAVTMPHWDAAGNLTGCKLRYPAGSRLSRGGSKFDALYGAWRGRQHADCLITEGETDNVWAAYQASLERLPLDVFSLPAGAKRSLTVEQARFILQRRGTVYLALDPDSTGIQSTRDALDTLATCGVSDARVCILPAGQDLRSAHPNLAVLLHEARRPLFPSGGVLTLPAPKTGFAVVDKEGDARVITNWHVEPETRLRADGDAGFSVAVHSTGAVRREVLKLSQLSSVRDLNRWANGLRLQFLGSDSQRKQLADWIEARASILPEEFLADRVGAQDPPPEYTWAGRACVYPTASVGQLPWRYAAGAFTQDVRDLVLLPQDEGGRFRWSWLESFITLSEPAVTHPLLAWLVAAARRIEVQQFPLLFISGSSGTGKTTLAELALRLSGSAIRTDLGSNTPFILYRALASSTTLPVFVDEWTRQSRADTREAFQGLITTLYAGGLAQRGQADLSVAGYHLTAPTIVAGEDTFNLDRERDRVVQITPSRAAQSHTALAALRGQPLELFGQRLHRWLALDRVALPELDTVTSTRPAHNRRILEAGWETLLLFLESWARVDPDVPALPAEPDLSGLERAAEEATTQRNAYEVALEEGLLLGDQRGTAVVWPDPDGRGTWVRPTALLAAIRRAQLDLQLPGGDRALLAYFRERYGETSEERTSPPGTLGRARAHLIPGLQVGEQPDALEQLLTA